MENVEAIKQLQKLKNLRTLLTQSKEALDIAINSLHTQWEVKKQAVSDAHKDEMLKFLFNRCRTAIPMCMWCGMAEECFKYRTVMKGNN